MKSGDIKIPRVRPLGHRAPRLTINLLRTQGAPGGRAFPIGGIGDYRIFMVGPGQKVARTVSEQRFQVDILCRSIEKTHPTAKVHLIRQAGYLAAEAFDGKTRNSGFPYFSHVYEVVLLLNALGLERVKTVVAAFLHDHFEDIDKTPGRKERLIGALVRSSDPSDIADARDVVEIVEHVTNLLKAKDSDQETIAHLIEIATIDIRPVLLKLADRLHNQEDWQAVREKTRIHKSQETRNIYAPFALKLGIYDWSRRLFDTTIRDLEPELFDALLLQKNEISASFSQPLRAIKLELAQLLEPYEGRVVHSPRSLWDIVQFSKERGEEKPRVQPIDVSSFKIIIPDEKGELIFDVFARLCRQYSLRKGSFEDAIHNPRSDFYKALHASFWTKKGLIRVQIQSETMHDRGNRGVASESGNQDWFKSGTMFARYALGLADELGIPRTRLQEVVGRAANSILIRTPIGEWIELPRLADGTMPTIIDFAAMIHSDMPAKVTSALMDGVIVPIKTPLKPFAEVLLVLVDKVQYEPERFKHAKTKKALKNLTEAYGTLPKADIVAGGRALLDNFMSRHLLSTKDLGRITIAQDFIRLYWRQNTPKHLRDAILRSRLGEDWESYLLEGVTVDRYGQRKGLALSNGQVIQVSFEDIYCLIGIGEIDPDVLGKQFIAFYAGHIKKILKEDAQKRLKFTFRISTKNVPGVLQQLLSPWAQYGINIENESGNSVVGLAGDKLSETTLTFSAITQIMQLQIPRQMRLFGNLPFVIKIEKLEPNDKGVETSTVVFEKHD